jgi:hypothetical protein
MGLAEFITDRPSEDVTTLCRRCLVREECLEFALTDPTLVGIFGGTTERERRVWRQLRGAVAQTPRLSRVSWAVLTTP